MCVCGGLTPLHEPATQPRVTELPRALDHACGTAGGARALPACEQVFPSSKLSRRQGDSSVLTPLHQLFFDLNLRMTTRQKLSLWVPLFSPQCQLSSLTSLRRPFSSASIGELLLPSSRGCSPPCCQLQPCPSTWSSAPPLPPVSPRPLQYHRSHGHRAGSPGGASVPSTPREPPREVLICPLPALPQGLREEKGVGGEAGRGEQVCVI